MYGFTPLSFKFKVVSDIVTATAKKQGVMDVALYADDKTIEFSYPNGIFIFIKVGRDNVVMTAWQRDEYEEPIDELHTDEIKHIMAFLDKYANAVV